MPRLLASLSLAALLALTGCAASGTQPDAGAPMATSSPSVVPSSTPARSASPSASPTPTAVPEVDPADWTTRLRAEAGDVVVSATETEPGRVEVETTIVDPRGDAGSSAAATAIAVCTAAVALGATYVSVYEADGSSFVLYGHPSYGNSCVEV